MQKKYFFFLVLITFCLVTLAQEPLTKQAILIKFSGNVKAGDTVEIIRKNRIYSQEKDEYSMNFSLKNEFGSWTAVSEKKLKIISPPFSFWKEQWFYKRSFPDKGSPEVSPRSYGETKRLLRELAAHDMFLEDIVLEDYLLSRLGEIFTAEDAAFFPLRPYPKVLKSQTPFAAGLNDGCIILSTGLLASIYSESELLATLTAQIGHFLMGHTTVNSNKFGLPDEFFENLFTEKLLTFSTSSWLQYNAYPLDPSYQLAGELRADMGNAAIAGLKGVGAIYSDRQTEDVDKMVREWLITHRKDPDAWGFLLARLHRSFFFPASPFDKSAAGAIPVEKINHAFGDLEGRLAKMKVDLSYLGKVDVPHQALDEIFTEALAYHAWHEYYIKRYLRSLGATSRLIKTESADPQIYLLSARLLRTMYPHGDFDQAAIMYLTEGRKRMRRKIPELHEEEILIQMRMQNWGEANKAIGRLEYMLSEMYEDERIIQKKEWATRMRRRVKLAEKNG